MHEVFGESQLLLVEKSVGLFSTVLRYGNGTEEYLSAVTPAKELIAATKVDYRECRREIKRLREEHPLLEDQLDISVADFEDFVAEALLLPSVLQKTDPVSCFVVGELLHQSLQSEDDGSASFLLNAGAELLYILEEPIRVQTCLRNVFEMTFDGMEWAKQRERFEKLCQVYPDIGRLCDPAAAPAVESGHRAFAVNSIFGLRLLELTLYFQQDNHRIARCDYCWGVVPKTKKVTRYCDRVTDGYPCKKRGARFKRNLVEDQKGHQGLREKGMKIMMETKAPYTVIVADDEDELREAVCTMIPWQEVGFRLIGSASNGLDALQMVEKYEPDLLLTDIRMPFISGIELARQVREVRPTTNIAFLSGFDDFEYAQQAIQYNIISYMLKPLTINGLVKELQTIHKKIDAQFAVFRQEPAQVGGQAPRAAMVMSLVLDEYAGLNGDIQMEAYARQCGLLKDADDRPCYTVMVSTLLKRDGSMDTPSSFAASVDRLAVKYLRSVSFFVPGKVVSVLVGNPSDFEEYLHILVDEIPQMASRVLGKHCHIGVSRTVDELSALHNAYCEAMEALRRGDQTEGSVQFINDLEPVVKGGSQLCAKALEVLDQHYMDADLSLVSLSGMLDVSPNHLSACIKKYAGETFINTLIRKRMETAQELLSTTALRIQEIAWRCGYTDQHYFSYCFKKYCGESPNAMRRRLEAERKGERL